MVLTPEIHSSALSCSSVFADVLIFSLEFDSEFHSLETLWIPVDEHRIDDIKGDGDWLCYYQSIGSCSISSSSFVGHRVYYYTKFLLLWNKKKLKWSYWIQRSLITISFNKTVTSWSLEGASVIRATKGFGPLIPENGLFSSSKTP